MLPLWTDGGEPVVVPVVVVPVVVPVGVTGEPPRHDAGASTRGRQRGGRQRHRTGEQRGNGMGMSTTTA
jgi:hypothetical protein